MNDAAPQRRVTAPLDDPPGRPTPPARWVVRAVILLMVMVGIVGATRLWWGWEADRRLAAAVEAARQRGEPVHLSEFIPPAVPDERNAAVLLLRAASAYEPMPWEREELLYESGHRLEVPLSPRTAGILAEHVHNNEHVLQLVRESRSRPEIGWTVDWDALIQGDFWSRAYSTGSQRGLAELLRYAAYDAHHQDNHIETVDYLRDALFISHALDQSEALIDHLGVHSVTALTAVAAGALAPYMDIEPHERPAVEALIADLLEEEHRRDRAVMAWLADRAMAVERVEHLPLPRFHVDWESSNVVRKDPTTLDRISVRAMRPLHVTVALWWFERNTSIVHHIRDGGAEAAPGMVAGGSRLAESVPLVTRYVDVETRSMRSNSYDLHLRVMIVRRINAMKLAIRLYEIDHGRLPDSLEALVPEYLQVVPTDPFDPEGRPLGYVQNAQQSFLYSLFHSYRNDVAAGWTPTQADHEDWRVGMFVSFYRVESEAEADVDQRNERDDQMQTDDDDQWQTDPEQWQ